MLQHDFFFSGARKHQSNKKSSDFLYGIVFIDGLINETNVHSTDSWQFIYDDVSIE